VKTLTNFGLLKRVDISQSPGGLLASEEEGRFMELCRIRASRGFSFGDRISVTGSPFGMCDGKIGTGMGSVFGNLVLTCHIYHRNFLLLGIVNIGSF